MMKTTDMEIRQIDDPEGQGHEAYQVMSPSGNTYTVRYEGLSGTYDDDPEYDAGRWSCTCPAGRFGRDCKHLAAVIAYVDGE